MGAKHVRSAFSDLPDRNQAWEDLHHLTQDKYNNVRYVAALVLRRAYSYILNKNQVWEDLHRLAQDKDSKVRMFAAETIGSIFSDLPDRNQAWEDLHCLSQDKHSKVRKCTARALGLAFLDLPDKTQAWDDLHRLIQEKDINIQRDAIEALGSAFSSLPLRNQAWGDLLRISHDKNALLLQVVAKTLGSVFYNLPDKNRAREELLRLAQNPDNSVRSSANHSLGKASIYKATEAMSDNEFKEEIEKAITFFDKAYTLGFDQSIFCRPFYRSFYAITFKEAEAHDEVMRYLKEAKRCSLGQKSKETKVEYLENLSHALLEVKRLENSNLDLIKYDLNAYMRYCENAEDLLFQMENDTSRAVMVLHKGLPIIDRRIKSVLREIEERAAGFCLAAKNTPLEGPGKRSFEQAQGLGTIEYQYEADRVLKVLMAQVRDYSNLLPPGIREQVCSQLKGSEREGSLHIGMAISFAFGSMATYARDMKDDAEITKKFVDYHMGQIMAKLSVMDFHILRLGQLSSNMAINSSENVVMLKEMKRQLESLTSLGPELESLKGNMAETDLALQRSLQEKDNEISEIALDLEKMLKETSLKNREILLNMLGELKEPMFWKVVNRASALASIIGLILAS